MGPIDTVEDLFGCLICISDAHNALSEECINAVLESGSFATFCAGISCRFDGKVGGKFQIFLKLMCRPPVTFLSLPRGILWATNVAVTIISCACAYVMFRLGCA